MNKAANPILVEVTRGPAVESRNRGVAVVVDTTGHVQEAWGDPNGLVFPRSGLKPIQAIAMVESGAVEAYGLTDRHIAIAAGSHAGMGKHIALIEDWLERLDLDPKALACGPLAPVDINVADELLRQGQSPSALHHNCSGKHLGFLTLARHWKVAIEGYEDPTHPVQEKVAEIIGEMTGTDVQSSPCGCDGCGIPAFALPASGLALALARMANPEGLDPTRAQAIWRITGAMAAHPDFVAGEGQFDTDFVADCPEVIVKTGAEGVVGVMLPQQGAGVLVKVDDGALRAAWVLVAAVLERLGIANSWGAVPVKNNQGQVVGAIRATLE